MSSGSVSLGSQRLFQYVVVGFQAGNDITGNSAWNVNTGTFENTNLGLTNKGPIGISSPGLYIIHIMTNRYSSGGYNYTGQFMVYKFGSTLYCKGLGGVYGNAVMLFDSNNLKNGIFTSSPSRVISTTGEFLIGMDTNYGGTSSAAAINVYHISS